MYSNCLLNTGQKKQKKNGFRGRLAKNGYFRNEEKLDPNTAKIHRGYDVRVFKVILRANTSHK